MSCALGSTLIKPGPCSASRFLVPDRAGARHPADALELYAAPGTSARGWHGGGTGVARGWHGGGTSGTGGTGCGGFNRAFGFLCGFSGGMLRYPA